MISEWNSRNKSWAAGLRKSTKQAHAYDIMYNKSNSSSYFLIKLVSIYKINKYSNLSLRNKLQYN